MIEYPIVSFQDCRLEIGYPILSQLTCLWIGYPISWTLDRVPRPRDSRISGSDETYIMNKEIKKAFIERDISKQKIIMYNVNGLFKHPVKHILCYSQSIETFLFAIFQFLMNFSFFSTSSIFDAVFNFWLKKPKTASKTEKFVENWKLRQKLRGKKKCLNTLWTT
jgi:hypothetical protein